MNKPMNIVVQGAGLVAVDGDMTFSGIDKKISSAFEFLTQSKHIIVDLRGVINADSAGLALLIEWIKFARSKRVQLKIKNVPNQILNLAKLSGLENADYFH